MTTPSLRDELAGDLPEFASTMARVIERAILEIDSRPAFPSDPDSATRELDVPLPDEGAGTLAVLERLVDLNRQAGANLGGPRCFHFVIGGSTPAALGADLLATVSETVTYAWVTSPLGVHLEVIALRWLRELFRLPLEWTGVMVTGGTMANFVGLAAGRQWWGEQHGCDIAESGFVGLPALPVLTSGYVHAATLKCLGLLGVGRANVQRITRDGRGRLDLVAFEAALEALGGQPALVVVNAGEVNAGDFDPTAEMIAIARRHNTWVHVDGAFGLFARVSPRVAHLAEGVELADSVAVDGHKWLNVPYDSGYAFVRDRDLMAKAFRYSADYLPESDPERPTMGAIAPESSRRGRSFAVWATLAAYGRDGYRRIVEHCLDLASHLAERAREEPELELLAEVQLNIVAFRFVGEGVAEGDLGPLNERIAMGLLDAGEFMVGTSKLEDRVILRPAFSNWRTRIEDVDAFVEQVLEIGRRG